MIIRKPNSSFDQQFHQTTRRFALMTVIGAIFSFAFSSAILTALIYLIYIMLCHFGVDVTPWS